eukprot:TRINITY_DN65296_c0_g1_i1.p1 TRINITY_DN65296_c0_g1~~TRINITY_DN65296_c0_g1_i1.p1  ORF type:complete len:443 (-),score=63.93 TRINITY_DN65296_c0_g1_i1:124-1452(-)
MPENVTRTAVGCFDCWLLVASLRSERLLAAPAPRVGERTKHKPSASSSSRSGSPAPSSPTCRPSHLLGPSCSVPPAVELPSLLAAGLREASDAALVARSLEAQQGGRCGDIEGKPDVADNSDAATSASCADVAEPSCRFWSKDSSSSSWESSPDTDDATSVSRQASPRVRLSSGSSFVILPESSTVDDPCVCELDYSSEDDEEGAVELGFAAAMETKLRWPKRKSALRWQVGFSLLWRLHDRLYCGSSDHADSIEMIRRAFLDSVPKDRVEIGDVRLLVHQELFSRFVDHISHQPVKVEATWHGTRSEYLENIVTGGLDPALCSTSAYGTGAYVGTHAGVAHQYADPDSAGWRHMFLMLAGITAGVVKGVAGSRSPSPAIAADSLANPTQYCFTDGRSLYAAALVRYRVTRSTLHAVGGGWDDPWQRALSLAISRAHARVII